MLTRENNELICRVGADTPIGKALRRYWIPVLQSSDLPEPDCDPFPLEIMGDRFVAFRNSEGVVGVLDEGCCHKPRSSLVDARAMASGAFFMAGSSLSTAPSWKHRMSPIRHSKPASVPRLIPS